MPSSNNQHHMHNCSAGITCTFRALEVVDVFGGEILFVPRVDHLNRCIHLHAAGKEEINCLTCTHSPKIVILCFSVGKG